MMRQKRTYEENEENLKNRPPDRVYLMMMMIIIIIIMIMIMKRKGVGA